MNLELILVWLLLVLLLIPGIICFWLIAYALLRGTVERSSARLSARPALCTLVGLVILLPVMAVLIGGHATGGAAGLCMVAILLLAGLSLLGSAGLALRVGAGLTSSIDETQPWRRMLRGSVALMLVCLLPLLGWFIITPLILASGFGSMLLARWVRAAS